MEREGIDYGVANKDTETTKNIASNVVEWKNRAHKAKPK